MSSPANTGRIHDPDIQLAQWLTEEPFTLALSSGYFGFFAHFGVLAALDEQNLAPAEICGSSSGALAAACWASGCKPAQIQNLLFNLSRKDIWDPGFGPGLLQGRLFRKLIRAQCPVENLEQCRIPIGISAFDLVSRCTHVLDRGNISNAVYASCCVPFLFQPIRIGPAVYIDGGIRDQHGLAACSGTRRTLHHYLPSRLGFPAYEPEKAGKRVTVVIQYPEPVGISQLKNGKNAFLQALRSMRRALTLSVSDAFLKI